MKVLRGMDLSQEGGSKGILLPWNKVQSLKKDLIPNPAQVPISEVGWAFNSMDYVSLEPIYSFDIILMARQFKSSIVH